eukprot:m.62359 g.62359  ORF g.62359 m.62359 type:complete len:650 (+) comp8082_c1_seq1:24-1973(+)
MSTHRFSAVATGVAVIVCLSQTIHVHARAAISIEAPITSFVPSQTNHVVPNLKDGHEASQSKHNNREDGGDQPKKDPLVTLKGLGTFRGVHLPDPTGTGTNAFLGIKYAVPPIGPLRFKPARMADGSVYTSQGTDHAPHNATGYCDECVQGTIADSSDPGMSEDCLCLNVWVPAGSTPAQTSTTPRPVFVFIHGGGFLTGSGSLRWYQGARLAEATGAVVVTINYRLGPLGFLVTDEDDALGNGGMNGLGDQILALKFIQQHISSFSGDPTKVTIGGQSSGSSAVCTLVVSPLAKGLFHQAMAQSGPCIGLWGPLNVTYGRAARARMFDMLNVSSVAQLRELPAANITWSDPDMNYILFNGYFTDGAVSPTNPIDRFLSGDINPTRVIFSGTSMDGVIPYGYLCPGCAPPKSSADYESDLRTHWGDVRGMRVAAQYPLSRFDGAASSAFVRADADGTVVCASYAQALLAEKHGHTAYAYLFDYMRGTIRTCDVSADIPDSMHSSAAPHNCTNAAECGEVGWASHASDIPFVFGTSSGPSPLDCTQTAVCPFTPAEQALTDKVQGYLGRFLQGLPPAADNAWPSVAGDARRKTHHDNVNVNDANLNLNLTTALGPVVNHLDLQGVKAGGLGLREADCRFWANELGYPWPL